MRDGKLKEGRTSDIASKPNRRRRKELFIGLIGVKNEIRENWLPDITMTIIGGTVITAIVNYVMKTQKGTIIGCGIGITIFTWIIIWMWIRHLPSEVTQEVDESAKNSQELKGQPQSNINEPQKKFYVRQSSTLILKYPGPILYVYPSKFGNLIAPVGYATVIEVANNRNSITQIKSVVMDIEIGQEWVRLYHLPIDNPLDVYWVNNSDLSKCTQLDFSSNSFDRQAKAKELLPGQSIRGWIFFEWPIELRDDLPHIKRTRIKIENTQGEEETVIIDRSPDSEEQGKASMEGGGLVVPPQKKKTDLSQLKIMPHMDLLRGFKEGTLK